MTELDPNKRVRRHVTCPACGHYWRADILLNRNPRDYGRGTCRICRVRFTRRSPGQNCCGSIPCKQERNRQNFERWKAEG